MAFHIWNNVLGSRPLGIAKRSRLSTHLLCNRFIFKNHLHHEELITGSRSYKVYPSPYSCNPSSNSGFSSSFATQREVKRYQEKLIDLSRHSEEIYENSKANYNMSYSLEIARRQEPVNLTAESMRRRFHEISRTEGLQPTSQLPFMNSSENKVMEEKRINLFDFSSHLLKPTSDSHGTKRAFGTLASRNRKLRQRKYWTKDECCPEQLECDEKEVICRYVFPCPSKNPPGKQPKPCPSPKYQPSSPKPTPIKRLCFALRTQKIPECKVCTEEEPFVPIKTLPCLPKSNCPSIEPILPTIMPPLKMAKKKTYQEIEEECDFPCMHAKYCIEKKCLPLLEHQPLCNPSIERTFSQPPPIKRINLKTVQKITECKEIRAVMEEPVVELKKLPRFSFDSVYTENPPLRMWKLKRLPKMCLCPEPAESLPEDCLRADDVCKYKVKTKKLKDWWCPKDEISYFPPEFCNQNEKTSNRYSLEEISAKISIANDKRQNPMKTFIFKKTNKNTTQKRFMSTLNLFNPNVVTVLNTTKNPILRWSGVLNTVPDFGGLSTRTFKTSASLRNPGKKRADKKEICLPIEKPRKVICHSFPDKRCAKRQSCEMTFPIPCPKNLAPYPAFSECIDHTSSVLTCECKNQPPYLQPGCPTHNIKDYIITPPTPAYHRIDPIPEENCILNELCRPRGITKSCTDFHIPHVALTQKECFLPHRIPCDKKEQICDFKKKTTINTCNNLPKEKFYYRCQCLCGTSKSDCFQTSQFPGCAPLGKKGGGKNNPGERRFSTFRRNYSKNSKHRGHKECVELKANPKFTRGCNKDYLAELQADCLDVLKKPEVGTKVGPGCIAKYKFNECPRYKNYRGCCKLFVEAAAVPKPKFPRRCATPKSFCGQCPDRVRFDCGHRTTVTTCCVVECPCPAFSDCHPPFRRLKLGESHIQARIFDDSRRRLNLRGTKNKKHYSCCTNPLHMALKDISNSIPVSIFQLLRPANELNSQSKARRLSYNFFNEDGISNIPASLDNSNGMTSKVEKSEALVSVFRKMRQRRGFYMGSTPAPVPDFLTNKEQ